MNRTEIIETLARLMRELADDESIDLAPETTPDDVEVWDSVLHINLLIAIESEFNIKFETSELGLSANVGELADLVVRKRVQV